MEAGNRCFDQRVPEEINRKVVDHTADINLTYSDIAREYLLREGLPAYQIIKTGSPMFEVLNHYKEKISKSDVLNQLELQPNKYFLVSAHREENIDSDINFKQLIDSLNSICERFELPVIVSTHPRTKKRIDSMGVKFHPNIRLIKPFGFSDYNKLQMNSLAVLSDSGTINEESSILNFRALNIREAHERPEGMEEAAVMMVGLNVDRILQCLEVVTTQTVGDQREYPLVADYSKPNVSLKVVRIIHSYVDYINKKVWRK